MDSCLETTLNENDSGGMHEQSLPLTAESVEYFKGLGMPWSKIAAAHGISRQGLYKFRLRNNIQDPSVEINNEDLESLISQLSAAHPQSGGIYMKGALTAMGIKVTFRKVKEVLRRVDPFGTLLRRRLKIHRRVYQNPGANWLWHLDSNHKLIDFRMVFHGCVDGFSRLIIYLNVATNNLANTVVTMFHNGVTASGLPKRVRGDRGVENVRVKDYMETHRPYTSNPFIHGRSVHNTRIERLWRESNCHIGFKYKAIFQHLESSGVLDEHNEIELMCLSYVFLPRIQRDLDYFVLMWNNHSMSTMNGRTPQQVWSADLMRQSASNLNDEDDFEVDGVNNYEDGYETNPVEVPAFSVGLNETLLPTFREGLPDPLLADGNEGIDNYIYLRNYVLQLGQTANHVNI